MWCLKGRGEGVIGPVDRVYIWVMRERGVQGNLLVSGMEYLVNMIPGLRNTREFGLGHTELEMLPSQDTELEMLRRLLDQLCSRY